MNMIDRFTVSLHFGRLLTDDEGCCNCCAWYLMLRFLTVAQFFVRRRRFGLKEIQSCSGRR